MERECLTYLTPSSAHPPVRRTLCDLIYSSMSSAFRSSDVTFTLLLDVEVPPLSGLLSFIVSDSKVGDVTEVVAVDELFPARRPFFAD